MRGFFGTLKSDFFGGRDWAGVTFEEFSRRLDAYIDWYRSEKVKKALGLEDDQAAQGGAWLYCVARRPENVRSSLPWQKIAFHSDMDDGIGSKISFGVVLRPLMAEKSVSE